MFYYILESSNKECMRERVKHRAGLADFLQNRRARLHPEQFHLPAFQRRRTHGLRREELAQLVGVGVSWYTWLEQPDLQMIVYTPLAQEDMAAKLRALMIGENQCDKMIPTP